jgi:hypothetical protein
MKTVINATFTLCFLLAAEVGIAQKETNDTTKLSFGTTKIIIIDTDEESDDDTTHHHKKEHIKTFNSWSGFELGVNGLLTSDNSFSMPDELSYMELDHAKSLVWNLNFMDVSWEWIKNDVGEEYRKSSFGLITGMGISFRNYSFENNTVLSNSLVKDSTIGVIDTATSYSKNKLRTTYLRVPVMLEYYTQRKKGDKVKNGFHVAAGVVGGLRLGSTHKRIYKSGGSDIKNKVRDDFNLNSFTLDAEARIGYGAFGFFASYGLNSFFEDDKGPELYPITVGISLTKLI